MRLCSSSFSRRVLSRLSLVTARVSAIALLSPFPPLSAPLLALPSPDTRRRLSVASTLDGADPAALRWVASNCLAPALPAAGLRLPRQLWFCACTWDSASRGERSSICCSVGMRRTWPLFSRLMLPSTKAPGFSSWNASIAWGTETRSVRLRWAISQSVSLETVR